MINPYILIYLSFSRRWEENVDIEREEEKEQDEKNGKGASFFPSQNSQSLLFSARVWLCPFHSLRLLFIFMK